MTNSRLGGVTTRRTVVVGYSEEFPDRVLKYEVLERNTDRYVLARPGHGNRCYAGHVGQFELLGTRLFGERERFVEALKTCRLATTWEKERERLLAEWDAFPDTPSWV
jgi:NAD(P)H-dependent flavin oxidoreductase YrpB (nitropropane dioxygenase family)